MTKPDAKFSGWKPPGSAACVIAGFLIKLAKHLALLTCLMIAGNATGRFAGNQLGLLLMVVSAALIHSIGRALQRPVPAVARLLQGEP